MVLLCPPRKSYHFIPYSEMSDLEQKDCKNDSVKANGDRARNALLKPTQNRKLVNEKKQS